MRDLRQIAIEQGRAAGIFLDQCQDLGRKPLRHRRMRLSGMDAAQAPAGP